MAVCRHCGAIIDDGLDICPDCGQQNTDVMDESYLDNLLNSLVESEPVRPAKKETTSKKKVQAEELIAEESFEEEFPGLELFPEFEEGSEPEAVSGFEDISDVEDVSMFEDALDFEDAPKFEETPVAEEIPEEESYNLFDQNDDPGLEAYNIFDELEENDVEAMIARELDEDYQEDDSVENFFKSVEEDSFDAVEENAFAFSEEEDIFAVEEDSLEELEDPFALTEDPFAVPEDGGFADTGLSEDDYAGLDELFQGFSEEDVEEMTVGDDFSDPGLEELLAAEIKEEETGGGNAKKKDDRSFWQRIFGNVPIDPSKKKPEPTEEEIAAAKQKKEEAKKKSAEEKKVLAAEKKAEAKKKKEEKARQAQLAKEEKQKKKLEEAKQLLEEMQETRINRVGASVVFILFAIVAVVLIIGSNLFTYSVSIANAEKNFNMALNNDVKYYTEAYNHIYGLEMRNVEDQELEDKILTVMFVNKELNSYNSYMALKDYESALHSLIKGLYRYGYYIEHAMDISIDKDMDFVRTQILRELEATFQVSEDESEILKSLLSDSLTSDEKAMEYSIKIYEIVNEAENMQ